MASEKDTALGRLAVERGYLTQEQLDEALDLQRKMHDDFRMDESLEQVLVSKRYVTPDQAQELRHAAAIQTGEARLVAGYEVISKLGAGGMGAVYKAKHPTSGQFVALKILPPSLATDELVERFRREAEIVRKLDHENIVACTEFGFDPKRKVHFCALELVEGEDLAKRVTHAGRLGEDEALSITSQIAMALQHAFYNGLVHRDVKPENVMVTADGTAKLLDLGLARPASAEATRMTESGMFVGSPYYASPEQALGEREIDTRADIYSLGATLYHMVTGKEVPVVFDQPACAYVKRLEPKSWHGKKLPERLPRIDGIHNICEDLEGEVARRNGGGHYRARIYDQATKKLFYGVHEFRIAFEPKIDGEPALPRTPKARLAEPVATRTQVEPRLIEVERRRRRAEGGRRGRKRQGACHRLDTAVQELKELLVRDRQQEAREAEDRRKAREERLKARREEERRAVAQLRRAFGSGPELSPGPGESQGDDRGVAPTSAPSPSSSDEDAGSDPEEPWHAATGSDRPGPDDGDGDDPEELDADTESGIALLTASPRSPLVESTASPSGRTRAAQSGHRTETHQDPMRALTDRLLDSATRSRAWRRSLSRLKTGLGRVADAAEALLVRGRGSDPSPQEESPPESTT